MKSIYQKTARAVQHGFTLVELLIVVIILAILAAIVIPQFSSSTTDAKEAALKANLAALRSAIELYKVQHKGKYPGDTVASGLTCTVGAAGTGDAGSEAALKSQLSLYSDDDGKTCTGADTQTTLGPYLRKGIPVDPLSGKVATVTVQATGVPISAPAAGVTTGGWLYDTKSGQIMVNYGGNDSKNVAYSTY